MTIDSKPFREAGLDLIPVKRGGKRPRDTRWNRRNYTDEEIDQAIKNDYNIGVRPGHGWVFADIDTRNQKCSADHAKAKFECRDGEWFCTECEAPGKDAYQMAADAGLDTTWAPTCITGGGGLHLFYRKDPDIRILKEHPDIPGVELKSGSGFVVTAGSKHPDGPLYEWDDCSPEIKDAPPLPELILARIKRPTVSTQSEPGQCDDEQLARLLSNLDAQAYAEYGAWTEIGMASWYITNGLGKDVFIEWSVEGDPEYAGHEESISDHWDSWAPDPGEVAITGATLLMHVRAAGGDTNWLALDELPEPGDPDDEIELPAKAKEYTKAVKTDRKRKLDSVVTLAAVKPQRVDWLVPYWIPARMLTLFTGNPAVLKSTVAIDIVARITRGDPMPFCNKGTPPGDVLILACEDPVPEVVVPRLLIAGADMSRVHVRQAAWAIDQLGELEDMVEKFKPKLIYIDALFSALQNMDTHRDNEVRGPLISMTALAAKHGATILATRHTRKGGASLAIDAGMASRAFGAVARSEILFVSDPDAPQDAGRFIMAHAKCNLKPRQTSQRYQAEEAEVPDLPGEHSVRVKWLGASQYTADQLASGEANDQGRAQRDAQVWLEDYLREHGPTRPRDLGIEAEEAGHNRRTLFRAVEASASIRGEGQGPARVWVYDRHAILGDNA